MVRADPIKEFMSLIVLLVLVIAFIPLFQELGVDYSFMPIFIFAMVVIVILTIILWIKEKFS